MLHQVFFSLGSNIGNRKQLIREAIALLDERVGRVTRESRGVSIRRTSL